MHRIHVAAIALIGFLTPYFTLNQEAFAQSSQSKHRSLSGVWKKTPVPFHGDSSGCHAGSDGSSNPPTPREITLVQNGTSVSIRGKFASASGGYNSGGSGEVRGNQFMLTDSGGGFTVRYEGTISDDGKTITGQASCRYVSGSATATGSFKWTRKPPKPVFRYIYINGINTPKGKAGDIDVDGRTCEAQKQMVKQSLMGNAQIKKDETEELVDTNCNLSGLDNPIGIQYHPNNELTLPVGDLVQAYLQNQTALHPSAGSDLLTKEITTKMKNFVKEEEANPENNQKNYFIIVAHSQGNYFAEKVTGELKATDQELFARLRVLAIASPTSYNVEGLIMHWFTRCDDIILGLKDLKMPLSRSVYPLPGNLPYPLRRDGKCIVPNLSSKDPLLADNLKSHALSNYIDTINSQNAQQVIGRIRDGLKALKRNLVSQDDE